MGTRPAELHIMTTPPDGGPRPPDVDPFGDDDARRLPSPEFELPADRTDRVIDVVESICDALAAAAWRTPDDDDREAVTRLALSAEFAVAALVGPEAGAVLNACAALRSPFRFAGGWFPSAYDAAECLASNYQSAVLWAGAVFDRAREEVVERWRTNGTGEIDRATRTAAVDEFVASAGDLVYAVCSGRQPTGGEVAGWADQWRHHLARQWADEVGRLLAHVECELAATGVLGDEHARGDATLSPDPAGSPARCRPGGLDARQRMIYDVLADLGDDEGLGAKDISNRIAARPGGPNVPRESIYRHLRGMKAAGVVGHDTVRGGYFIIARTRSNGA